MAWPDDGLVFTGHGLGWSGTAMGYIGVAVPALCCPRAWLF